MSLVLKPKTNKPPPGSRVDWNNPINRGLQAWYLFNEGGGNTAQDITGNDLHAEISGTWDASSAWKGAADGGGIQPPGGDDSCFLVEPYTEPKLANLAADPNGFSLMLRLHGAYPNGRNPISKTGNNTQGWLLSWDWTDQFRFIINYTGTNILVDTTTNDIDVLDEPGIHTLIITSDNSGLAAGVRLFLDGNELSYSTQIDSTGSPTADDTHANAKFRIGGGQSSSSSYPGTITDTRVWRRVLTPDDIKQLHKEPYEGILSHRIWSPPAAGGTPLYVVDADTVQISEAQNFFGESFLVNNDTVQIVEGIVLYKTGSIYIVDSDSVEISEATIQLIGQILVSSDTVEIADGIVLYKTGPIYVVDSDTINIADASLRLIGQIIVDSDTVEISEAPSIYLFAAGPTGHTLLLREDHTKPPSGTQIDWGNPINHDLESWFIFNEGNGRIVRDLAHPNRSLTYFSSTRSNYWIGSIHGCGIDFDGSTDRLDQAPGAPLEVFEDNWTISLWVKSDDVTQFQYLSEFGSTQRTALYMSATGKYNLWTGDGADYPTGTEADTAMSATDQWDHIVWVRDGTNLKGYLNGALTVDVTLGGTGVWHTNTHVQISGAYSTNLFTIDGAVSDWRLWGRSLNQEEVALLHAQPYGGILPHRIYLGEISAVDTGILALREDFTKPAKGMRVDWGNSVNNGLRAWWAFNEQGGNRYYDVVTDRLLLHQTTSLPYNWTGNAHGGTPKYNGSSEYAQLFIPDAFTEILTEDITIAAWVRPNSLSPGTDAYISEFGGTLRFALFMTTAGEYNVYSGAYPTGTAADTAMPATGGLDHVVWVKQGTNLKGYVNGVNYVDVIISAGTWETNTRMELGRAYGLVSNYWAGDISDWRMWDRALNGEEVRDLHYRPYGNVLPQRIYSPVPFITPLYVINAETLEIIEAQNFFGNYYLVNDDIVQVIEAQNFFGESYLVVAETVEINDAQDVNIGKFLLVNETIEISEGSVLFIGGNAYIVISETVEISETNEVIPGIVAIINDVVNIDELYRRVKQIIGDDDPTTPESNPTYQEEIRGPVTDALNLLDTMKITGQSPWPVKNVPPERQAHIDAKTIVHMDQMFRELYRIVKGLKDKTDGID